MIIWLMLDPVETFSGLPDNLLLHLSRFQILGYKSNWVVVLVILPVLLTIMFQTLEVVSPCTLIALKHFLCRFWFSRNISFYYTIVKTGRGTIPDLEVLVEVEKGTMKVDCQSVTLVIWYGKFLCSFYCNILFCFNANSFATSLVKHFF